MCKVERSSGREIVGSLACGTRCMSSSSNIEQHIPTYYL